MKKQVLVLAAVAMAAGVAMAQSNDTLAKIKSSGVVNLGVRDSSGLGFTIGGGKYVGFHTEMAERIVDDLKKATGNPNLKINYQVITSQNRIPLLQNGTIDFECGSTTNNLTRQKDVAFAVTTPVAAARRAGRAAGAAAAVGKASRCAMAARTDCSCCQ